MIHAGQVERLYFRALRGGRTGLAATALEAIELGCESTAWAECERVIDEVKSALALRRREWLASPHGISVAKKAPRARAPEQRMRT